MATARMTLMGLYNFDNTLFQGIELPEGLDGDILAPELLQRCGSFELLYPNLEYMKFMIPWWFAKNNDTFTIWIAVLKEEYDPLYNFDGHEEIRDEERYSNGKSHDVTATTSGIHDATSTTTNLQNEKSVSACDSRTPYNAISVFYHDCVKKSMLKNAFLRSRSFFSNLMIAFCSFVCYNNHNEQLKEGISL